MGLYSKSTQIQHSKWRESRSMSIDGFVFPGRQLSARSFLVLDAATRVLSVQHVCSKKSLLPTSLILQRSDANLVLDVVLGVLDSWAKGFFVACTLKTYWFTNNRKFNPP
jgi:hypothetical protein